MIAIRPMIGGWQSASGTRAISRLGVAGQRGHWPPVPTPRAANPWATW